MLNFALSFLGAKCVACSNPLHMINIDCFNVITNNASGSVGDDASTELGIK